jgi:hypothetical protein
MAPRYTLYNTTTIQDIFYNDYTLARTIVNKERICHPTTIAVYTSIILPYHMAHMICAHTICHPTTLLTTTRGHTWLESFGKRNAARLGAAETQLAVPQLHIGVQTRRI